MFIQLANLLTRVPNTKDMAAIAELISMCDVAEERRAGHTMEDLQRLWRCASFDLSEDARVIVTRKGQFVGFGCVWHGDSAEFSIYVCVHPDYRKRGIGTLLLRLVEDCARQRMRQERPEVRVSLRAVVSGYGSGVRKLFEREGYACIRDFWRVTLEPVEVPSATQGEKLVVDVDIEARRLVGASALYDREGLYTIQQYCVYEKELRPSQATQIELDEERVSLAVAGES